MEPHLPETTVEKMLIQSAASKGRPITATLELTPLCNLRCDMCYIRLDPQQVRCRGGLHPVADWLALARRMADAGVLFVLLTGGEPLLFPGFRELYLELRRLGMVVTVNTNGTLLDQDWADFFAAHPPRRVNITLYGGSDAAYAALCHAAGGFQKAIRAISLLKDRGVAVKINSSAAKANRDDLESIYRIGRELDVPVHLDSYMLPGLRDRFAPFEEQSRLNPGDAARAELLMLRRETPPDQFHGWICQTLAALDCANPDYPRQSTCQAGRSSFAVGWDEAMRPCVSFLESRANAFRQDFESAWAATANQIAELRIHEDCGRCRLRPLCKTCPAAAHWEMGRYDAVPDYLCRYAGACAQLLQEEKTNEPPVSDR